MTPERQLKAEEIHRATLRLEPGKRAAFLAEACGRDAELYNQVQTLLETSTVTQLAPGVQLGPYRLAAPLGSGGMGEVWKAHDTRLDRTVALKRLKAAHTERFRREARAIAALNHPHICQLYDAGPDYLVMEYIEGVPLQGPLALEQALRLAIQIASALEAAHQKGIVHRDLKPGNVLVTKEGVKLLDFGLAKREEPALSGESSSTASMALTGAGTVVGTVAYMSPEQAQGLPVDARSDIFSFGTVLYEMLSGRRPFRGDTSLATLSSIVKDEPPRLAAPPEVERIVRRCLAKKPEERFRSAHELRGALEDACAAREAVAAPRPSRRYLIAGASAAALAAAGALGWRRWGASGQFDSLAVMPLTNATGEPETDFIAEGVAESVINRLSQTRLKVIARTTAFRVQDKAGDPIALGRELGVSAVMTGRLTRQGGNLVVQAELVNTRDGSQIWGDRFVRPIGELEDMEAAITTRITEGLQLRLTASENAVVNQRRSTSPQAYQLYLRGLEQWNRINEGGYSRAIEYFSAAIDLDPQFARAHAGLAHAYALLGVDYDRSPREVMPAAKQAAETALRLDDSVSEAHVARAMYLLFYAWDWSGTEQEFLRAIELDRNNSDALHYYSHYLESVRRTEEAISVMQRGVDLDRLSLIVNAELGFAYYCAQQYGDAIRVLEKTAEMDPTFAYGAWVLAQSLERTGQYSEALAALERAQPGGWIAIPLEMACAHAAAGRPEESRRILADLQQRGVLLDPALVAMVYAELSDVDQVIEWLEKAYTAKSATLVWINVEPKFAAARSDPRFQDLLRRLRLV